MSDLNKIKLKPILCDIKNADKGFTEKWTNNRVKKSSVANFPHPSRICLVGPPSVGKTFMIKHLLLHQRPLFEEAYVIHADSNETHEYDDLEVTMMMDEFPPISFWDGKCKTLCIIDDVEFSNLSKDQTARLNKLLRYGSSHKNVSVYISNQNFFELPSLVRKMSNVFILWKPRSTMELKLIANRVGMKPDDLEYIFENICNEYRDSLCIDLHINTPSLLRKNIFQPIKMTDNVV